MANVTVFVDESGDLGFDHKSSKFFVIGYVMMINNDPFFNRNKVTRLKRDINTKRKHKHKIREFKFSNDSYDIRIKFLKLIAELDVNAGVVLVSKDSVVERLRHDPPILYNYLSVEYIMTTIINNYLKPHSPYNRIDFRIDESLSKNARKQFNRYCSGKIEALSKERPFVANIITTIEHLDSNYEVCLQIADYIASSTFVKLERSNSQYHDIIKSKIKHKDVWDFNKRITW